MEERKNIFVSAFWVSLGTGIARLFGFFREVAMAAFFGTGIAADAFAVAFRFPNLLQFIIGEGAFSAAFLPKFAEVRHKEGEEAAFRMASAVLTALIIGVVMICALGILFAPQLISVIVIGWENDPARKQLAVKLVRIVFSFIAFIGLASYCQAILNVYRKFFVSSVAPTLMNLSWLVGILVSVWLLKGESSRIQLVAGFVVFGSLLQFLWQLPWILRLGWKFSWAIKGRKKDLIEVGKLFVPSLFGLAARELYFLADVIIASFLPGGSVSSLTYANRLLFLPLGLIGFAISTAVLPTLSDSAAQDKREELASILSYTARSLFTLLLPIGFAAIVMRYEIVRLLFERGNFTAGHSTPMVASALMFYMIGVPFFALQRGLTQGFYALKDTKTPVYVTIVGLALNIELSVILMDYLALGGIALGSSITAFISCSILTYHIKKKLPEFPLRMLLNNVVKVTAAGAGASVITIFINKYISSYLAVGPVLVGRFIQLAVPSLIFLLAFLVISKALRIREIESLVGKVKEKFSKNANS